MTVTLEITKVDFDTNGGKVRLSGKNVEENKWIKVHRKLTPLSHACLAGRVPYIGTGAE